MITDTRRSVDPRVEPGLNPIQPKSRMNVPVTTNGMLCPGIAFGVRSLLNLPIRGPSRIASASAHQPPVPCTTPEPARSTAPCPRFHLSPSCESQPPPHSQLP